MGPEPGGDIARALWGEEELMDVAVPHGGVRNCGLYRAAGVGAVVNRREWLGKMRRNVWYVCAEFVAGM